MKRHVLRAGCLCLAALFVLSAALLCAPSVAAEESAADLAAKGVGYTAVLYDNSSGLPTSVANDIVQSPEGFIYIGCYSGLIRYDGNTFYRYSASTGIFSVVSLYMDSRGRLWVGTNDSGVAVLEDETFRFYNREEGLRASSVRSVTEDAEGNIYVATTMGMAYIDTAGAMHVIDNPQINTEYIMELYAGSDGTVYGVTLTGGVFTVKNKEVTYYKAENMGAGGVKLTSANTVYADPDRAGYVYVGSSGVIYHGDLTSSAIDRELLYPGALGVVNAIRKLGDQLWVCGENGVGIFGADGNFRQLQDLPMNNSIDRMIMDYEGNLWFTSSQQGVMKIVKNRFTDIGAVAKINLPVVNSTCLFGTDLYIGTNTGLYILNENFQPVENALTALLEGVRIRCIKKDGDTLWLCTYGDNGLVHYTPAAGTWEIYSVDAVDADRRMLSQWVRMLTKLSDGRLVVANQGITIIENDAVTGHYDDASGISNLEVLCVEEGPDGKLYLGSDGDGIYVVDGARVYQLGTENGLKSGVVMRIKKDPKDDLYWIVTSNSLAYMKDEQVTTLFNFPYFNNFDIYFDNSDRAWVLCSGGVYVVKRDDLIADKEGMECVHYDSRSGLPGIPTANAFSDQESDGTLYICSKTSVYSVNINAPEEDGSNLKLSVPFLLIDDEVVWLHGKTEIHVPADCKRLNIYANAFTFALNNPHLCYYLEGFDDEPIYATKQEMQYASYTNLKGGTYRFHLSLINEATGEVEQTLTVTIIKDKSYYEQPWFWTLMVTIALLIVAGAAFLVYHQKAKKLLQKQEEDAKLINQMTRVFSSCIDMKDAYTNGHSARVAKYTAMFAERLGKSPKEVEQIYNIALLHDIGKISIPDNILNKPGRLNDEEYAVMKSHSSRGYEILKDIDIAPGIALGAGYHHEKYDGTGYPKGLAGNDIPEIAQIIAVADAFDAMYSTRPYRRQMPLEKVAAEIERCSGTQFSPRVVAVFLQLVKEGVFDRPPENTEKGAVEIAGEGNAPAGVVGTTDTPRESKTETPDNGAEKPASDPKSAADGETPNA